MTPVYPPPPTPILEQTARHSMAKFAKGDYVRVHATKFDCDEENVNELGLKYSERQLHDGKKGE